MLPVAVAQRRCRFGGSLLTKFRVHALSTHETSPVKRAASVGFRQRAASALMHPVTLGALGVLLINDLLFKALWPGAWIPGKLSDLAWMIFAPPVLAFLLSFLARRNAAAQRAAFLAAYVGLPLLYAAFNTFAPVHDVVLRVLGVFGGDGPRSPLDPTDSLVIPFAMTAALWVWRRPPLRAESIRVRLALLAAVAAALASVASTYPIDRGITEVGRTASGALGAHASLWNTPPTDEYTDFESMDGGLTWTVSNVFVPLERQAWNKLEVKDPSGAVFIVDDSQIVREWSERDLEGESGVSYTADGRLTAYGTSGQREVVYSYEYLRSGGNRWMQALDKRDVEYRLIATSAGDLFYDDQSGNLIVAMGLQGVVVIAPDGTSTRVAVGRYSPTDFSFGNKVRTFFNSLLQRETMVFTGIALMLTFSFATLALAVSRASARPRCSFALAAAIAAFLAVSVGVYPRVFESSGDVDIVRDLAFSLPGWGLLPLLLAVVGMVLARTSRRRVLAVAAASVGMLPLVALGGLVLFETGTVIANFVAVGLVGAASFGLWAYQKRRQGG